MKKSSLALGGALACCLMAAPSFAQGARIGSLECDVSGGPGFIITSAKALDCYFYHGRHARPEHYVGTIRKFGLDLGATAPGALDWAVFASTGSPGRGALAGEYGGVGASATPGVGVGANALIGGSNRTISLQPFSVQAQTGLNVAAGVTSLDLEYVPDARPHRRRHR
ncbi:MAG: DUF992 domain-containing protein [Hyphomicrobiales bacterium]|nr:DUF992 domain-containing protein [Hyphomicrobiales bacterium]